MEIQVPDIKGAQTAEEKEIKSPYRLPWLRKCIYIKGLECEVPNCHMEICRNCPYGYIYFITSFVKDIFNRASLTIFRDIIDNFNRNIVHTVYNKIIGMAISLAGQDSRFARLLSKSKKDGRLISVGKIGYFTVDEKGKHITISVNRGKLEKSLRQL